MITELGKKCLCPVLQCCNCRCLHISFLLISLAAQEAQSIPMASLWAHFTLGSGWNCLSCFGPLSQSKISPFYFSKNYRAFDPSQSPCGCFHTIFCRIAFSGPCPPFISALSIWLTFISVLTEVAVLQLNFYIITFFQLLHVFLCSKTSLKKVLGRWHTFIWLDMQVQVIGSSVLDSQDKQWHIGGNIDPRRTLNWGLELWQYAWCHECAWTAWIWNVAEASWPDMVSFHSCEGSSSKFRTKIFFCGETMHRFLIQSISAATDCRAQPLHFSVLLLMWISYLPDPCFFQSVFPWDQMCVCRKQAKQNFSD